MKRLLIILLTVVSLALPISLGAAVSASKVRCGTHLVGVGDTSYDVLNYCGSPTMVVDADDHGQSTIWFYDKDNRLLVRFYINNGTVYQVLQGK